MACLRVMPFLARLESSSARPSRGSLPKRAREPLDQADLQKSPRLGIGSFERGGIQLSEAVLTRYQCRGAPERDPTSDRWAWLERIRPTSCGRFLLSRYDLKALYRL